MGLATSSASRISRQAPAVAIVNETFVTKLLNGADPIGRVIRVETAPNAPPLSWQIVGVSGDAKHTDLKEDFAPLVILPASQASEADDWVRFVIKPRGAAAAVIPAAARKIAEVNPSIDIDFSILSETIRSGLVRERLMAALSGAFGLLAGLLAAVGLYGILAGGVNERVREIGVRSALARWDAEKNSSRLFRPFVPAVHPQLGEVEVGGLDLRVGVSNPPFEKLGDRERPHSSPDSLQCHGLAKRETLLLPS